MNNPASQIRPEGGADTAQRSRRLMQITTILICALAIGSLQFSLESHWKFSFLLFAGIVLLFFCQWLNRRGAVDTANFLLLSLCLVMAFLFIWSAEGLFDETTLTLPVILVMTGLMASRRHFLAMLGLMFGFIAWIYVANAIGLRHDTPYSFGPTRVINIELILLVGSLMIWIVINDARNSAQDLRAQIQAFHESEQKLTYLSQHDELTGLPNRIYGRAMLDKAVLFAGANNENLAILFIDLDHFKSINDSLGHAAGDRFLIQMAKRLASSCRANDIVCRLSGDEFLIGIVNATDTAMVRDFAYRLSAKVAEPLVETDMEMIGSCSIGIAIFPRDGRDLDTLMTHADMAMYAAKAMGRNVCQFYSESMHLKAEEDLRLISGLHLALSRDEFELLYQPVYRLPSREIVGAEALIRWNHPERGKLLPSDFIPAAEKSGLIHDIGEWVLIQACLQMVQWQREGNAPAVLAVNLSPVQFRRGNLTEVVRNALRCSGLASECLELELTESTAIEDAQRFIDTLMELKSLGVKIAIDDFGTGYSNLSYLQRFKVDKLKIDQSFVKALQNGTGDHAIVTAVIQLAKSLGLSTVAEGIEDESCLQQLIGLECDCGQGFWLARPQPAQQFYDLLNGQQAAPTPV